MMITEEWNDKPCGSTATDRESVERIRTYVEYPYTSPGTVVLNSALVRLTARDLAQLLEERDALLAENEKLRAELTVARHDLRDANMKVMRVAQERDELRAGLPPTLEQALQVPEVAELCAALREYMEHDKDYTELNYLGDHSGSHRWKRASAALAAIDVNETPIR